MQCPHISWLARLDQYPAVCCIETVCRQKILHIYYKLYLPQWHRQKLHITVIIFFLSSFFLSLIINLEYFVLRPDLTIDLHACWFFCSLKKRMLQKSKYFNQNKRRKMSRFNKIARKSYQIMLAKRMKINVKMTESECIPLSRVILSWGLTVTIFWLHNLRHEHFLTAGNGWLSRNLRRIINWHFSCM